MKNYGTVDKPSLVQQLWKQTLIAFVVLKNWSHNTSITACRMADRQNSAIYINSELFKSIYVPSANVLHKTDKRSLKHSGLRSDLQYAEN